MKWMYYLLILSIFTACGEPKLDREIDNKVKNVSKTMLDIKKELVNRGYEVFDYVDEETKDTVLMQQYFIAFLKSGPNRSQSEQEADSLQSLHLAHLKKCTILGTQISQDLLVIMEKLEA